MYRLSRYTEEAFTALVSRYPDMVGVPAAYCEGDGGTLKFYPAPAKGVVVYQMQPMEF